MKDRRKRKQREEVRKILATMRLELAAQRLSQEKAARATVLPLNIGGLIQQSKRSLVEL